MSEPVQIIEENDHQITIVWSNETENLFEAAELRKNCPCAGCVNEWTGEKMLKIEEIPEDLNFVSIGVVGRYALNFKFSDGHDTGIFSYKYLYEMKN